VAFFDTGRPAGCQSGFSFQFHTNSSICDLSRHFLSMLHVEFFLEVALSTAGSDG
jgi:hypothetical protein